ncbi:peptidase M15 [Pacificimonas flava]|uniref:D-alanyl-D-alanine dipeptidase n=2 Tax=Pacificimonas TaxID=1960290 RepID=A0A219B8Y0_9SPHN|nr:peptidase M15 [Pacificimonas flava]
MQSDQALPIEALPARPSTAQSAPVQPQLIDIHRVAPNIRVDMRYYGDENFTGRPVPGYEAPQCLLSLEAAHALGGAQAELAEYDLGLKVFDCYRPQRAVDAFAAWAKDPADTLRKADYYPDVPKSELFERGYIARRSGHSRASTVDLTLVDLESGKELDMGSGYDLFDTLSWPADPRPDAQQRANRLLLRQAMLGVGFRPLKQEWWHFTLADEPYPDSYFDVPVR